MALNLDDIQPAEPMAKEPVMVESAPAPEEPSSEVQIPDEVLQIPAMNALLQGKPPAVSAPVDNPPPEAQILARFAKPLSDSGFGFYTSKDNTQAVMFNHRFITPEEIVLADERGQLNVVAPPLTELSAAYSEEAETSEAPASEPPPTATTIPAPAPSLTSARLKSLAPGPPTSGPVPGAGRILNSVLKPVV